MSPTPALADSATLARPLELSVTGMTCAACAARVERKLNKLDGVEASVNFATGKARISAVSEVTDGELVELVERTGYGAAVVADEPSADPVDESRDLWRRLVVAMTLFVPLADLSILFTALPQTRITGWQWVLIALAAPVAGWSAWPLHRTAFANARRASSSMDTLVSVGIIAASVWSLYAMFVQTAAPSGLSGMWLLLRSQGAIYLEVAAGVTTFVLAGRYFEAKAKRKAGGVLRALAELRAKDVTVLLDSGQQRTIAVGELCAGQRFVVRPGSTIAADGVVVEGQAAVDRSTMTGESVPEETTTGSEVIGGTVVLNGRLLVEATKVGQQTALAGMVRLVEEAQASKAGVQRLADKVSGYFVPAVLVLALLTLTGWLLVGGSAEQAFTAGLAVLVIACPCALGLATPTALMVASGRGAHLGIFIKGYQALESTRDIDTVVVDKTGTVTTGQMSVVDTQCVAGTSRATVLRLTGALENVSEHAVAAAISTAARAELDTLPRPEQFTNKPGLGACGVVDGHDVVAGRRELFAEMGLGIPSELDQKRREWEQQGRTVVLCGLDGQVAAVFALADRVKPSAAAAVRRLHQLGLRTVLLTGDNEVTAQVVAREVGIEEAIAGVMPHEKVEVVRRLQAEGRRVAVVGDGINDAPALATADLGLAIGAGTDVAIEAADLILVRDELVVVPDAIRLARGTLRTIRGNLVWAFGYNVAALPLAVLGLLNPLIAGAAMAVSSLFVVSNSLRLNKFSPSAALAGE